MPRKKTSGMPPVREHPVSTGQLLSDVALYGMSITLVETAPPWLAKRAAEEMRVIDVRRRYPRGPWPFQAARGCNDAP
jgi:hypothetical protein